MKVRYGLAILAALGLTACAERDISYEKSFITDFGSYQPTQYVNTDALDKTAWNETRQITLTVRQNEFSPMVVRLKKDVPYTIRVVNQDKNTVSFDASDLFENSAVAELSEAASYPARSKPLLKSFVVPSNGERMVKLVPVLEGRYEFEDNAPGLFLLDLVFSPWSRGATKGTSGVFIVE
ncbi:cupredoxin domain-containing protein [Terasakiella sp. SH-1]|uniref:cupredoxin domain-containing protein n=1 Tax=Terasakiella sp. SH-1 TaxID=2560057 RepID=UPI0010741BE5|nr:cupredoxin domain-containing protein [Terasakiella sp. SH-1]